MTTLTRLVAASLVGWTWIAACSEPVPSDVVASLDLRGTRIDGSDDPDAGATAASQPDPVELAVAVETIEPRPNLEPAESSETPAGSDEDEADPESEAGLADEAPEPAADVELGRLRDDGVRELSFQDLSLEGIDYELLVDSLLFPDEYQDEGVELPANVAALSGQQVAIGGYMIPGKIERGGNVRDFMLVRDLLACCFGGIPKPDEWVDVVMADDTEAEYIRYRPMIVTGTLTVGEDMDADAFNPAVFKLVGTRVRRRE